MRAVQSFLLALFALALLVLPLSCSSNPSPTAQPTATFAPLPTATLIPTATPMPTPTPTPQPTALPPLNETDRTALIALFHATGGPDWTNNHKWLSDAPLGEWHGVTIDAGGRVVDLQLLDNGLTGELPPRLGELESLTRLCLCSNDLTGEIPPELGRLADLTYLDLGGNGLSGEIPSELGSLTSLIWLNLDSNELSGVIPPELGGLSSLVWLDLHSNEISGEIPSELGNLAELTYLELYENNLTGRIPVKLSDLPYLETLTLGENQLSGRDTAGVGKPSQTDNPGPDWQSVERVACPHACVTLPGKTTSARSPCYCVRRRWRSSGTRGTASSYRYQQSGRRRNQTRRRPFSSPYDFRFHNPDRSWAVSVIVGDMVFPSLAEYADILETSFLEEGWKSSSEAPCRPQRGCVL